MSDTAGSRTGPAIPSAGRIRLLLEELPPARPGDYRSHGAFAGDLFSVLAEAGMRKAVPEETAMRIRGLIRRDAWYEAAVLHDLSIIDRKGQFSASLLRAWMLQAAALERCPPYGILRSIARAWQHAGDGTCRLFRPGNLPGESEHATPPRPAWLAFIEEEPPAAARPPYSYFSGFLRILEKYRHDLRFLHYHCFMDAHERDLL